MKKRKTIAPSTIVALFLLSLSLILISKARTHTYAVDHVLTDAPNTTTYSTNGHLIAKPTLDPTNSEHKPQVTIPKNFTYHPGITLQHIQAY